MAEEVQEEDVSLKGADTELEEYLIKEEEVILKTHQRIHGDFSGKIQKMENGYVEVELETIKEMLADDMGLVHGGFIFSAADYAAMAAVNERNVVLVASDCQFLSPVKLGDKVSIKATVRHKEGRKRNVNVEAFVLDIKVFEGVFKTVVTERHVLKLKLLEEEQKTPSN
ncbi:PaaI family thioesterase [Sulfurimonas lithotrophica]|uniref:PaaI family thioesterase n=1 Tax=Sulfurimonas lithotrophica TaxID=2590022 RepID=A0A5P8P1I8_9BACT|nr:hotdog domain-containing protein [Sulfurimonas lithotrophica]QFR49525.1 PaaI family thioesterase [Sulfurimonas lithotrophica]